MPYYNSPFAHSKKFEKCCAMMMNNLIFGLQMVFDNMKYLFLCGIWVNGVGLNCDSQSSVATCEVISYVWIMLSHDIWFFKLSPFTSYPNLKCDQCNIPILALVKQWEYIKAIVNSDHFCYTIRLMTIIRLMLMVTIILIGHFGHLGVNLVFSL